MLTRKTDEKICIGPEITITIVSIRGGGQDGRVRVGIDAPKDLKILRVDSRADTKAQVEAVLDKHGPALGSPESVKAIRRLLPEASHRQLLVTLSGLRDRVEKLKRPRGEPQ